MPIPSSSIIRCWQWHCRGHSSPFCSHHCQLYQDSHGTPSTVGRALCFPPHFSYKPTRQEITSLSQLFEHCWFFTKWNIKGQQHGPGLLLAKGAAAVYRTKEKQRVTTAKPTLHCHTQLLQLLTDSYLGLFFDCFRHSLKQFRFFQSVNIFSSSFGKFMFSGTCWTILSQQGSIREKYILNRSEKK